MLISATGIQAAFLELYGQARTSVGIQMSGEIAERGG